MPPNTLENTSAAEAALSDVTDQNAPPEQADAGPAEPSTAPTEAPAEPSAPEPPVTIQDVIQDALKDVEDPDEFIPGQVRDDPNAPQPKSPDEVPAQQAEAPPATDDDADLSAPLTDEEIGNFTPRAQKRIHQLLDAVKSHEAKSSGFDSMRSVLRDAGIERDQFETLVDLASALNKGQFDTFLNGVAPFVQLAQEATGQTIAPDLYEQVQGHHMTTEAAQRITQQRTAAALERARIERQHQQTQRDAHAQGAQARRDAVAAWQASARASDPDFDKKAELTRLYARSMSADHPPRTPQEAVAIAQKAYEEAGKYAGELTPKPKATSKQPSPSSVPSTGAKQEPQSMLDAVFLGLERANTGG